jgi:UDP-N-acetylglucosamine--N-acetylmuramyl-(pentapeptide) pyrophosphoryl-undecaprenol N-acetylglucosamine transferase
MNTLSSVLRLSILRSEIKKGRIKDARGLPDMIATTNKLVLLAAGGTGGHLFPAFALAEELTRRGVTVDLVTDERGDRYGVNFPGRAMHQVASATPKNKGPLELARTGMKISGGTLKAWRMLGGIAPSAVIGFGGYPTVPPLLAATLRGIPRAVHEQNAIMGRANRMLASRITALATSWENTRAIPDAARNKVTLTGNPVRQAVIDWARTPYEPVQLDGPIRLVVFGGSQGARFFSEAVPPALALLPEAIRRRLHVTQQCREEDLLEVQTAYTSLAIKAELAPFFKNLPEKMAHAHLVMARSGASSVAELAVLGRPSLLVPLPHALDNDQLHNAKRLAEAGGAWVIEQKDLSRERLGAELSGLFAQPDRLAQAAQAAKGQGRPGAVAALADFVMRLAS